MKTYHCTCGQLTFFENVVCVACTRELGFLPDALLLSSLEPAGVDLFKATEPTLANRLYKKCQNYAKESVCNWMIPVGAAPETNPEPFCASCRLNQTIPDLSREQNHELWAKMERAKRRLLYSLLSLGLPIANKTDDPEQGLAFAFLEDVEKPDGGISKIMTGYENGLITLNIAEADDVAREQIRLAMREPQRTLLGHFRHEIGHYYWDRLVRNTDCIGRLRELFGNDEMDYTQALQKYYARGAPTNWRENFISAYSTAHPWEDWAESWAHFIHIQDTLEVARGFGLVGKAIRFDPNATNTKSEISSKPKTFEEIIQAWADLTIALNSINRCMGLADAYPFVFSSTIVKKFAFIFEVISAGQAKSAATS